MLSSISADSSSFWSKSAAACLRGLGLLFVLVNVKDAFSALLLAFVVVMALFMLVPVYWLISRTAAKNALAKGGQAKVDKAFSKVILE